MKLMQDQSQNTSLEQGLDILQRHVKSLPATPGVYRMLGSKGEVLYVGKARALKKRVASYLNISKLPIRLQRMIAQTAAMEFIHTHTEAEALLLEGNLIKKLKPRFNILLRDDKSFPYILIPEDHDFPQVLKHRGAKKRKGSYFGPFAGAGDVNHTIDILQRAFLLRNCTDSYFAARKRPCLQYHIKRCTAPCVNLISREDYAAQVEGAREFLNGKSRAVQDRMTSEMEAASNNMDYEKAAQYRDRIRALTSIQARQDINIDIGDADVIALHQEGGQSCVQIFFFRAGRNLGNRSYFPRHAKEEAAKDILTAFIGQFYQNKPVPREILISHAPVELQLLEKALTQKAQEEGARFNVKISVPQRGKRGRLMDFARHNAAEAFRRKLESSATTQKLLLGVAELFGLDAPPGRIEVYDNSHISGTNMTGVMIAAGAEGFIKNAYRKFNIRQAGASDDYAMMREVLARRFSKLEEENRPDLVLIDGGQGQFNAAYQVLQELGIEDRIRLAAIAKGPDRNAGRETFYTLERIGFTLEPNDPMLHYLQRLRDEAHRFAILGHRGRRTKQITQSLLDSVPGIGSKRKKALLLHFGSAKAVAQAGIEDLEKVEGISRSMAQTIYDHFHG